MRIPWGVGVPSDATKIKASGLCDDVFELKYLLNYSTDWADATDWTEKDSSTLVNLSGGVWTFNGNGSFNANGIYKTTGHARNIGYLEFKYSIPASTANNIFLQLPSTAAFPAAGASALSVLGGAVGLVWTVFNSGQQTVVTAPITANTFYTIRLYIDKSANGTSWKAARCTIQGGTEYVIEKEIGRGDYYVTELSDPFFPVFQRVQASTNLASIKEYRWYAGYATDSPYITYTADAGSGKTINGLTFTNLTLPTGIVDTNLEFDYSFDDGTPSYSSKYSLTALKALGAISGSKRYLRVRVYQNSNGTTQTYGTIVNADDAVTSVGAGASAPGAFVLTATARPTSILLQWTNSTGYDYFDIYQDTVKINTTPITDAISYLVEDLTEETAYTFKVTAVNGTDSTDSNTVTKTTLADGYLPTDTVTKQLLETIRTQVLAIKDSTATAVFSSDNVVIGYINDLAVRTGFPCIEIYPTGSGSLGSSYESQRTISSEFMFSIVAHQRVTTTNRDNGTDLYEINQIGEAIRAQIFRLNDLSQAGTEPCTGFIMVQPTYTVNPQYEVFSEKVNSVIVDCAIRADNEDVGI